MFYYFPKYSSTLNSFSLIPSTYREKERPKGGDNKVIALKFLAYARFSRLKPIQGDRSNCIFLQEFYKSINISATFILNWIIFGISSEKEDRWETLICYFGVVNLICRCINFSDGDCFYAFKILS
mmetsp:Transcript_29246/g.37837  ORF Transcript_29246/g.37837 Transcript_29246/m.37837 type:complete len:125 (-) Transcript_29246:716-1090(-)